MSPVPPPGRVAVQTAGNQLVLTWNAVPGVPYQVQYQTNLASSNWLNLTPLQVAVTNSVRVVDVIGSGESGRFYRVVEGGN